MAEYGKLNKVNYKNLFSFLEKNDLEIRSAFGATDLDCAYNICSKTNSLNDKLKDSDFYVCFMFEAYDYSMFSWNLTNKPCMSEADFINVLKDVKVSELRYLSFSQKVYSD